MAVAAKGPLSDNIMSPDQMKPLLALSKREPVQAAIGLTSDGEGVILLDKKRKPKQVRGLLLDSARKAKLDLQPSTIRFGRAEVDTEYDPGMVRFFINKDAPGQMRTRLVTIVKRIPYQKVEINVDPTLELEEETGTEPGEAPSQDSAPGEASSTAATAPTPPPGPGMDGAALTRELMALARRIAEVTDAGAKAGLAKLAGDGNTAIKAGQFPAAEALIKSLRDGLRDALDAQGVGVGQVTEQAPGGAPPPRPPKDLPALTSELGVLARQIALVSGEDAGLRGGLAKQGADVQAAIKSGDLATANTVIDKLREAIDQARARGLDAALGQWKSARAKAVADLDTVAGHLNQMEFGPAPEAVILLRAIAANLTAEPRTRQQVDELRRYLETDDIIAEAQEPNGFGVVIDLYEPLLGALDVLEDFVPA